MSWQAAGTVPRQRPFDAAVILPTLLRPSLDRAVRSVFAQDFPGRIQLLVGIDVAQGERAQLAALARDCPDHVALDIVDPGYSTSTQHGGLYPNRCTGSLRTVLSYVANSRYLAYLDDDNWWAPDHLASLRQAVEDVEWSWSRRWFVEPDEALPICIDAWESVGPGSGLYAECYDGFVDPSSLMLDKLACHHVLPYWSLTPYEDGRGSDRLIFEQLKGKPQRGTGRATSFYTINPADALHLVRLQNFRKSGFALPSERRAGIVPLASLPGLERVAGDGPADGLLQRIVGLLRPAEAVILGAGARQEAKALARAVRAAGLDCLCVAEGAALASARLAVDLVQLGSGAEGPAAWREGFRILRAGGFLLGHDPIDPALERFAIASGSHLLPVPDGGGSLRWILEKGLGAPRQELPGG